MSAETLDEPEISPERLVFDLIAEIMFVSLDSLVSGVFGVPNTIMEIE